MRLLRSMLLFAMILALAVPAYAVNINEIRIDDDGGDQDEYFELAGTPGESLDGLTYLVIGDGAGLSGTIENVTSLDGYSIQADGYFAGHKSGTTALCTGYDAELTLNFENGDNVTHLVVSGFSGANADDLDTNDDGVLDVMPWASIVDWVSLVENTDPLSAGFEWYYSPTVVGPDGTFVPGHAFLCGVVWQIGQFLPECVMDTPGALNACAVPTDAHSWGAHKARFNN